MIKLANNNSNYIALYIHLPWCVKRCPYCDFNAHTQPKELPETEYLISLEEDLIATLELLDTKKTIISIFFGGGTPSLFSTQSINKILTMVNKYCTINKNCEITLEANPGTLDDSKLKGFNEAGINRLSIGAQSFNNEHLQAIGRIHNKTQVINSIKTALELNFNSINIDLMFGLPQQNQQQALSDLQQAINFNVHHISWYELTIEPNTLFAKSPPKRVDSDTRAEWTYQGHQLLKQFNHYEVSAFAKPGFECQHNSWIWSFGDYLGIGAGAHSKITNNKQVNRYVKQRHPRQYMANKNKIIQTQLVTDKELAFEYLLNRLRLKMPISWDSAKKQANLTLNSQAMQSAIKQKFINHDQDFFYLTKTGQWFLDDVVSLFLNVE